MRVFVSIVAVLFVLVGVVGGAFGALVIAATDTDVEWQCRASVDTSSDISTQNCSYQDYANGADRDRERDLGLATVVGGAAFLVGGCALLGGAVAAGRRERTSAAPYPPQPYASAGAAPGHGGWSGGGQPGETPPRS